MDGEIDKPAQTYRNFGNGPELWPQGKFTGDYEPIPFKQSETTSQNRLCGTISRQGWQRYTLKRAN